jgi:hypothetical protein
MSIPVNRIISFCLLLCSCNRTNNTLNEVKELPHYPSASGVEYFKSQFYIMGDDATHLLILDSNLNTVDSIPFYTASEKRIPKDIKPDLESIAAVYTHRTPGLLLSGSGSSSPYRNTAVLFDPVSKQKTTYSLDTFYQRIKNNGLTELNIEGSVNVPGSFIMVNRGHKGFRKNHLILTSNGFWEQQLTTSFNFILFGVNNDTSQFQGVSGLAYARRTDKLIATVSTEDTRSVYEDGAIGKSYLWIVDNISSKKRWNSINPNRIIDLESIDSRFKGQKIESACVVKEARNYIRLVLVADNDKGTSTVFQLDISKK